MTQLTSKIINEKLTDLRSAVEEDRVTVCKRVMAGKDSIANQILCDIIKMERKVELYTSLLNDYEGTISSVFGKLAGQAEHRNHQTPYELSRSIADGEFIREIS